MIDLHVHSTFSDGSFSPEELVAMATEAGLTAMALTDHDSTDGVKRFMAACEPVALTGVPGVEISADVDHGTMHILGYFVQPGHPDLEPQLERVRSGREGRNQQILEKLNEAGLELTWEEVAEFAGEDVVGRPHFAQAMLARGYVKSNREVFDQYLGKGKAAYVDRFRLSPADGIAAIRKAGGVAVLSHPFTLDRKPEALRSLVAQLVEDGLQGIEVHYSEHGAERVEQYLELTRMFDLVATGGSDFHGAINPDVKLGVGFGPLRVSDDVLTALQAKRNAGS